MKSVYIHIPFCKQKCRYCSFISYPKLEFKDKYIESLKTEIKERYKGEVLETLYIGGGTPSLLSSEEIFSLIELFNTKSDTEITIELNPETITAKYLSEFKNTGINRLSFGCQTFNDDILKQIGRIHSSDDVINSIKFAQDAGFKSISLDFIYGLPNQTVKMFENDLQKTITLDISHISLYGLKIDKDCYFYKNPPENLPDEDIQADMYLKAIEILSSKGFEHYEISNFSKKGFESKHNLNYWNNGTYYGFGCAAHGYENGVRYSNKSKLEDYIANPLIHENFHNLTEREKLEEEIFLGFRRISGINVEEINRKYKIDFREKYKKVLDKYVSYNFLKETSDGFKLTKEGILISNNILSEFLQ